MILHVSLILSTGGRGWWYPSMHCRCNPSMPCSRGVCAIPACLAVGGYLLLGWGLLPLGACSQGGTCFRECLLWGRVCSQEGLLLGGVCSWGGVWRPPPKADGYSCGWYASYWNAFLYFQTLTLTLMSTFDVSWMKLQWIYV